jgi:hypothetical protein
MCRVAGGPDAARRGVARMVLPQACWHSEPAAPAAGGHAGDVSPTSPAAGRGDRAQTMSSLFVRVMFLPPPNFPKSPRVVWFYFDF